MSRCSRLAPALLLHVSLLLALLGGAGLATAARLKWDPTTYVVLRELFPAEYRVGAAALGAASAALLALGHVAALALCVAPAPRLRRALLLTHAALMTLLLCGEAAWLAWSGARAAAWLRSAAAAAAADALELRDHVEPLLRFLARWHPLPGRVRELLAEAEADAPRNLWLAAAALLLAAALQPAAALLALLAASSPPPAPPPARSGAAAERAPLKAAYRRGKLVLV